MSSTEELGAQSDDHPVLPRMDSSGSEDNQFSPGARIHSKSSSYDVLSVLGRGAYGNVVKCRKTTDNKTVAVKTIKNHGTSAKRAIYEILALLKIKKMDADKCHLVQWYSIFSISGHVCIEFELLDKSLYDFVKERNFRPLQLKEIRPIVHQLADMLDHLKVCQIIHADLKLENVMLVNQLQQPYKIKVIDFGLAAQVSTAKQGSLIQTLPYRSPEILLGAPFTEAIDIWSVGCIAAFLYTGALLYPGKSEYDMVRYIVETQGQPPDNVLEAGLQTSCFFQMEHNFSWKLKTPEQYQKETTSASKETRRFKFRSLDRLLHFQPGILNTRHIANKAAKTADVQKFVELLKGMLQLDAAQRLTPRQVLEYDFSSMCHLEPLHDTSSHVQSCFHIMSVCSNKAMLQSLGGTGFDPSELNETHDDEPCCGSPASPEVYEIMAHDERSDPS
ncbi:homeodomain-interacting protein kinase 1-like isoform X1 [Phyllopteryx taeniolatus]|uniref:homeodomain-interacting protein kinase 1-like isoform X1 n=1 Tax=Phyllopteryx taeniolatus TaxID=161469 RepID=UPI002AD3840A|nr:homeodomain-interacting protein kinase 1-like isoform X1 [Phyllopteryx taeniolatus]